MFLMNNPGERKQTWGYINGFVARVCARPLLVTECHSVTLFITIQSSPRSRGEGTTVRGKDQTLNEWFPRQNKTAQEFVPLNSFPASVPPGSGLFTEHRNGLNKRLWMHVWNEVSTAGFPSVWQRLSAQLLYVRTTREVPHKSDRFLNKILYNTNTGEKNCTRELTINLRNTVADNHVSSVSCSQVQGLYLQKHNNK